MQQTAYHERLVPGVGGWLAGLAFAAVLGVALWPASPPLGVALGAVAAVVAVAALWFFSPVVEVSGGQLRAGRAHIPVTLLGDAVVLDPAGVRTELGPRLDARAYVCLRTWARTGVRIPLDDPADPTPYWLVSTRRPAELAAALTSARTTAV